MNRRRACEVILLELIADRAQARYDRTRSHHAWLALMRARADACRAWRGR